MRQDGRELLWLRLTPSWGRSSVTKVYSIIDRQDRYTLSCHEQIGRSRPCLQKIPPARIDVEKELQALKTFAIPLLDQPPSVTDVRMATLCAQGLVWQ